MVALVCSAGSAQACTLCHSDLGEQVRERLFDAAFVSHALGICAPLPFFVVAILWVARRTSDVG
jgi:hypothetical protein